MLQFSGINRGSFSLLADAVERYADYDWHTTRRCAFGIARQKWEYEGVSSPYLPVDQEGPLVALGINRHQALILFFNMRYADKDSMVGLLRSIASGGNIPND